MRPCQKGELVGRHLLTPSVQQVSIYADVAGDDSYTPQKISLRAGTYHGDLHEVRYVEMVSPKGWQHFWLAGDAEEE